MKVNYDKSIRWNLGREGWLMPVIPGLSEVDHEIRDGDPPGQHGETLSPLKIQKLAGH